MIAGMVKKDQISEYWPLIKDLIQNACDYSGGRADAEDYLKSFNENKKQLWVVKEAANIRAVVITEIAIFPKFTACMINICTGEGIKEWGHMHTLIEDFARNMGCKQMFVIGRPGMERLLKNYRKTHVLMEKTL